MFLVKSIHVGMIIIFDDVYIWLWIFGSCSIASAYNLFFQNRPVKSRATLWRCTLCKEQYFRETGCLQSKIILDGAGNLIDGYTSYLLAKAHGLVSVPIRYGRRQIVRASHRNGGKLYAWELPGLLVGRVSVGEKLMVRTSRGLRTVTVAEVEEYAGQDPEPLRMAIRKPRGRREAA